jgi:hypothetical protein
MEKITVFSVVTFFIFLFTIYPILDLKISNMIYISGVGFYKASLLKNLSNWLLDLSKLLYFILFLGGVIYFCYKGRLP